VEYSFQEYQNPLHFSHRGTVMIPTSFNRTSVGNVSICSSLHLWHVSFMEIQFYNIWILSLRSKIGSILVKIICNLSCLTSKKLHPKQWKGSQYFNTLSTKPLYHLCTMCTLCTGSLYTANQKQSHETKKRRKNSLQSSIFL